MHRNRDLVNKRGLSCWGLLLLLKVPMINGSVQRGAKGGENEESCDDNAATLTANHRILRDLRTSYFKEK